MEALLDRSPFQTALERVADVGSGVAYFESNPGFDATLSASDGVTFYSFAIPAKILEHGSAAIPTRALAYVKTIPTPQVRITSDTTDLLIEATSPSRKPNWRLGLPMTPLQEIDLGSFVGAYPIFDRVGFSYTLESVLGALAGGSTRPYLRYVQFSNGVVRAYSGSRFHCIALPDLPFQGLLPEAAARLVVKLARSSPSPLALQEYERGCEWSDEHGCLANLWDRTREYPDLDHYTLEPEDEAMDAFEVDRKELIDAINRIRPCADESGCIEMDLRESAMRLSAIDELGQEARDQVAIEWPYKPRRMAFAYADLRATLGAIRTGRVLIRPGVSTRVKPGIIHVHGGDFYGTVEQLRLDLQRGPRDA